MSDKYISVTELKKKLNYIFRANGVSTCTKEAINGAIKRLPFVFKGELETTLETSAELEIKREAVREFAEKLKAYLLLTRSEQISVVSYEDIDKLVSEMFGNPE